MRKYEQNGTGLTYQIANFHEFDICTCTKGINIMYNILPWEEILTQKFLHYNINLGFSGLHVHVLQGMSE